MPRAGSSSGVERAQPAIPGGLRRGLGLPSGWGGEGPDVLSNGLCLERTAGQTVSACQVHCPVPDEPQNGIGT